jgi:hypothetical protein
MRYPAPAYRVIGTALEGVYWLQTALPGRPLAYQAQRLPPLLPRLLALHQLHVGQAPVQSLDVWPDEVVRTVLVGGDGYCLLDHSPCLKAGDSWAEHRGLDRGRLPSPSDTFVGGLVVAPAPQA